MKEVPPPKFEAGSSQDAISANLADLARQVRAEVMDEIETRATQMKENREVMVGLGACQPQALFDYLSERGDESLWQIFRRAKEFDLVGYKEPSKIKAISSSVEEVSLNARIEQPISERYSASFPADSNDFFKQLSENRQAKKAARTQELSGAVSPGAKSATAGL